MVHFKKQQIYLNALKKIMKKQQQHCPYQVINCVLLEHEAEVIKNGEQSGL
jgi:hypothetical protein